MDNAKKIAIIIGAGPAGLTAAYELLTRTDIQPIILEKSDALGGLSRTVHYKGNRMDLGGHRFFSKSDRVMDWWLKQMPIQADSDRSQTIAYHGTTREIPGSSETQLTSTNADPDHVMLLRKRKSRIYFLRKFFDYPITLSWDTLAKLGVLRTARIAFSYLRSAIFPQPHATNLEQFFINRFGRELYETFFKSYTEKVWGVPCREISAEWGQQRIKGLSIAKTISHFISQGFRKSSDLAQKNVETSLIEQFLYPKFGPGQMWEGVAQQVLSMGGQIITNSNVTAIHRQENAIASITASDKSGVLREFSGDYFFSTMAIKDLIRAIDGNVPANVKEVSEGLRYRDFITVGILTKKLKVREKNEKQISDNWIYLQEPDVQASRLQIINNWSPSMVADPSHIWMGVEYFCDQTGDLWNKSDAEIASLAIAELHKIAIIDQSDVLDSIVVRVPKTHPAYFGTFARFSEIRSFVEAFENLFLIGRNGMHRYNNQDHSMLTAMVAVDNIVAGLTDKSNLWAVNTEMEYQESTE
jgi:protoporphyrinogen oxidase